MLTSPHPLTSLPSIYNTNIHQKKRKKYLSPVIGLFKWTIVAPIFSSIFYPSSDQILQMSPKKSVFAKEDLDKSIAAYSKLHHGILTFLSTQRKVEDKVVESEDEDLEPGELIEEEGETQELITPIDLEDLVENLKKSLDKLKGNNGRTYSV